MAQLSSYQENMSNEQISKSIRSGFRFIAYCEMHQRAARADFRANEITAEEADARWDALQLKIDEQGAAIDNLRAHFTN